MKNKSQPNLRLTASELGMLWTSYINDSMAICVLKHFLAKADDKEVIPVLKFALNLSQKHVEEIAEIFKRENQPVPEGFTDNDVDTTVPRLFSDTFGLVYLQNMSRLGLMAYGATLPLSPREDTNDYFHKCIGSSADLSKKITKVMLKKGIYTRSPYVPVSEKIEYIRDQQYMNGWVGKQYPLNAVEINDVFMCELTNIFSKVLFTGYAQVAKTERAREYLKSGKKIASKHTKVFADLLTKEDLSSPQTWNSEVTESTQAPFSDKLMVYHTRALSMGGIATYGGSMSTSMRHDLIPMYGKLAAELGKYGDKGMEIMIAERWMEKPPTAADRNQLIHQRPKKQ
ncbi:DUF3231 family protein [Halobacillus naozhouensis]|uniref:DUF3231 family protein n=1 Tax=Halobacillus naozhouensis TaxID=554880 RepID=A0ABY8J181_9BACI|nr:DUF3231 family protein [Halobacillus naozhouensis]WFT76259.1 DUF3231 family protein [Halobacillus naozhouensis]